MTYNNILKKLKAEARQEQDSKNKYTLSKFLKQLEKTKKRKEEENAKDRIL